MSVCCQCIYSLDCVVYSPTKLLSYYPIINPFIVHVRVTIVNSTKEQQHPHRPLAGSNHPYVCIHKHIYRYIYSCTYINIYM